MLKKTKQYKPGQLLTIKLWNLTNIVVRIKACESNYNYSPCTRCIMRIISTRRRVCHDICPLTPFHCYFESIKIPKSLLG